MKGFLILLLAAGCSAHHITHYRSGWSSCRAVDPDAIRCGDKQMAKVICFKPGDESCGALAIDYLDGERVFLWRPPDFEPEDEDSLQPGGVIRPELASDGSMIWFKSPANSRDGWTVFEPETGVTREVDAFRIFSIREKDPHSLPLWVVAAK
ncbi:MAG TPA: hypothetical protein VMK66_00955 [Myxococcales bacterium]|nr:hypothetical protein [Myxococcales bacterium]